MPRTRQSQSPLATLTSVLISLGALGLFILIVPTLVSQTIRSAVTTPGPSGSGWIPSDAATCLSTAQALLAWPDDHGGPVSKLGLGISDDIKGARPIAVASSRDFLAKAQGLRAPGAEGQLAAYQDAMRNASDVFAKPITLSEFRDQYRAIGNSANQLLLRCHAVERWVADNYRQ